MRHLRNSRRFGREPAHRKAMFRNMVTSLFVHERILTTLQRAKELRRVAEKLVTLGKRGDLAARRVAAETLRTEGQRVGKQLKNIEVALKKLFETIAPRYVNRHGGYTRIIKTGRRVGDNAPMAFIELIPEETKAATPGKKSTKKATTAKAKAASAKAVASRKTPAAKAPGKPRASAKKPAANEESGSAE